MKYPTPEDITAAYFRIKHKVRKTPLLSHPFLDKRVGGKVFLKADSLQIAGCFKYRGAVNAISVLTEKNERPEGGVVAYSSGNHAQALALAASSAGLKATIFIPSDVPQIKRQLTEKLGGTVISYDRYRDDREVLAAEFAQKNKAVLIPPYEHFDVIAGQGSSGLEIAEQLRKQGEKADHVFVPTSGGGSAAGIALALKLTSPTAKVHTAEPENHDDWRRSLLSGQREKNNSPAKSICDGLMASTPGEMCFAINRPLLGEGYSVSDEEVLQAVAFAFLYLKLVLEPSGAAALAVILSGKAPLKNKTSVALLSGGNTDPGILTEALQKYAAALSAF